MAMLMVARRAAADDSGILTVSNVRDFMSTIGEDMDEEELESMFSHADVTGNGLVEYVEFSRAIRLWEAEEVGPAGLLRVLPPERLCGLIGPATRTLHGDGPRPQRVTQDAHSPAPPLAAYSTHHDWPKRTQPFATRLM